MTLVLKKGMKNVFVGNWQRALSRQLDSNGNPYGKTIGLIDEDFGKKTHNATLSFQADRGLPKTGEVDWNTWMHLESEPSPDTQPGNNPLTTGMLFIQAKNYKPAKRTDINWIVIHTMEAAESSTTARRVAEWFGSGATIASCHYCVDDVQVVQCVHDEDVAHHAPGANRLGIGIEHAGYARQTSEEWADPFSKRMLALSARLVASLCAKWSIPIQFVKAPQLLAGVRGITTHYEVSQAWKDSTHWDPGPNFPMVEYLEQVKKFHG